MKKKTPVYDIFLSHSSQDVGLAAFVRDGLMSQGLSVFELEAVSAGTAISKSIREGLVDSLAVVLLITPSSETSGNMAFEAGMAMAWAKPVFVLYDGRTLSDIPEFLQQFEVFSVDKVRDVAKAISKTKQTLKPEHVAILSSLYVDTGIPTDQLLLEPSILQDMSDQFFERAHLRLSTTRLAQELVRMRKTGRLPKMRSVVQPH